MPPDEFIDPASQVNQPFSFEPPEETKEKPSVPESKDTVPDDPVPKEPEPKEPEPKEPEPKAEPKTPEPKDKEPEPESKETPKEEPKPRVSTPRFVQIGDQMVAEADLIALHKKNAEIDGRQQQTSDITQKAQAVIDQATNDPMAFLQSLGADATKIREDLVKAAMEEELLTEHEIELRTERRKTEALQQQIDAKTQQEASDKQQMERSHAQEQIGNILATALEGSVLGQDVDSSHIFIGEMATILRQAQSQGYDPTPGEIAAKVESKYFSVFRNLSNALDGEQLTKLLGDGVVKKMRKYDLDKIKPKKSSEAPSSAPVSISPPAEMEFIDPVASRIIR